MNFTAQHVYCTACLLVVLKNPSSKLHCQKGFDLIIFSYETLLQEFVDCKPLAEKFGHYEQSASSDRRLINAHITDFIPVSRERTPGPSCPQTPEGASSTWPCRSCNEQTFEFRTEKPTLLQKFVEGKPLAEKFVAGTCESSVSWGLPVISIINLRVISIMGITSHQRHQTGG